MKIKGKKVFTKTEIEQLLQLIKERRQAPSDKQKSIRNKMRKLGFYGRDEWGITVKDASTDESNRSSFIKRLISMVKK